MDEKDYELLLELYESKNITKTAQKLFLTQPAITKRIQKMEEELSCQLFFRSKKGVIFTPAAEGILPCARAILSNTRRIRELADSCQKEICGTISLGSSLNVSHYRLPAILKQYKDTYPKVEFQITTGQSRHLFRLLKEDRFPMAILRGTFGWSEEARLLTAEPMCLVCSRENAGRSLSDYPYISRHTDAELSGQLERWLAARGLSQLRSGLCIDSIDTCREMARYGLGWCILPKICLEGYDGYQEDLYLDDGTPFVRKTYVLCKSAYAQLPQVRIFLDVLAAGI